MAYDSVRVPQFERDYDSILDYLVNDLCSPSAASNLMDEVDRAERLIAENPYAHAVSTKSTLRKLQYRECFVMNYVMIYTVVDLKIVFARMFHQSQDYERFFYRSSL